METVNLPNVGDFVVRVGKLVATEDVTPPAPPREIDYIFETVTARCELRLRGETIKQMNSYCSWHPHEEGVAEAISAAKCYASARELGPESELEVVVVRIAEQYRMRPAAGPTERFRALAYGCKRKLPEPVETVAWSSKKPDSADRDP